MASQSVGQFVVTSKGAVVRATNESETQMHENERIICGEMSASSPQFQYTATAQADHDATTGRYTEMQKDNTIIHHEQSFKGQGEHGIILGGERVLATDPFSAQGTSITGENVMDDQQFLDILSNNPPKQDETVSPSKASC